MQGSATDRTSTGFVVIHPRDGNPPIDTSESSRIQSVASALSNDHAGVNVSVSGAEKQAARAREPA
jgi:hypothetical protein